MLFSVKIDKRLLKQRTIKIFPHNIPLGEITSLEGIKKFRDENKMMFITYENDKQNYHTERLSKAMLKLDEPAYDLEVQRTQLKNAENANKSKNC